MIRHNVFRISILIMYIIVCTYNTYALDELHIIIGTKDNFITLIGSVLFTHAYLSTS